MATRFLAVRARGAHPDRLKPRPASPFRKGDLVELHLEKGEPQGHVVDVKTCPRTGEAINFKVDLGKGRLVWRGVAALKTP